jgi:hypothetical protein
MSKSEANGPLGAFGFVEQLRLNGLTVCVWEMPLAVALGVDEQGYCSCMTVYAVH